MRISDWSSDVCSSDLIPTCDGFRADAAQVGMVAAGHPGAGRALAARSEERRAGKECVSTCRSRWSPYHLKKKNCNTNKNRNMTYRQRHYHQLSTTAHRTAINTTH